MHVWGVGRLSNMILDLPDTGAPAMIELKGNTFVSTMKPELFTRVAMNGKVVATIHGTLQKQAFEIRIGVPKGPFVAQIDFATDNPTSPKALGLSLDDRELTVSLTSVLVREVK